MKNHNGMSRSMALAMGAVLALGALSMTACKDDDKEGTALNGAGATNGAATADGGTGAGAAGTGAAGTAGTRPRDGRGGTDAGMAGNGDIDNLIGGDGDAAMGGDADAKPAVVPFAERDYSDSTGEANWNPDGLRVAYTGKKLPCDGSVILKGAPIDKTTAEVRLVDVNEGRVPVDCIDKTTLILTIKDVPKTVKTIRFYDNKGAMTTLDVIGAKKR